MPIFKNLLNLGTGFVSTKIFVVIHDSMQIGELIPNITLVLRQNVCLFFKTCDSGAEAGLLGHLLLGLCSHIQYGAMTKDKPYIGK